ncbi:LysR family transcriptional regulator [Acetobacter cibinongensis]|uniref:HTH lysR-type domain-containing protein n=1 Tax=Acetobacter cibinongensis TaxID=146475 RepID=A0A1Z5YXA3_9PROT|nr:LysR family transcriptional regulator [Acetobacter cibinongensis]OUJ03907.1 hypothetical protein HK14_15415 [Acetobacter cibinongensis]
MKNFRKNVPSLNALVTLEAVVRHRSFTMAAGELGVSQAAVSRQIAVLEQDLGIPLFIRGYRTIDPTPNCLVLVETLSKSFADIMQVVDCVRVSERKAKQTVTIRTSAAFATLWLLPRLGTLHALFPTTQIRLASQDSRAALNMDGTDVAVWFGLPPFEKGNVVGTRKDTVYPVCSPSFLSRVPDPDAFLSAPAHLIEHDNTNREWDSWRQWFIDAGIKAKKTESDLSLSHYADVLAAAKAGQGVALGWHVLVRQSLEDGSLTRLGSREVKCSGCYNVITSLQDTSHGVGEAIALWILQNL